VHCHPCRAPRAPNNASYGSSIIQRERERLFSFATKSFEFHRAATYPKLASFEGPWIISAYRSDRPLCVRSGQLGMALGEIMAHFVTTIGRSLSGVEPAWYPRRSSVSKSVSEMVKRLARYHPRHQTHQAPCEKPLSPSFDRLLFPAGHALMARRPIWASFSREAPSRACTARPRATAL
jgi:hypothetical protein